LSDADRSLFLPDPPLVAGALRLRPWTLADGPALARAWADPEVQRWTGAPAVADEATALRWIEQNPALRAASVSLDLVVELGGAVAGEVGLVYLDGASEESARVELGWWVAADHRGRGVASAAVRCFTEWVLDPAGLGFGQAFAVCARGNPASAAVAVAAGFEATDRPAAGDGVVFRRARTLARPGTLHP
jgi:RimJ/RimL family protein N-acetyltransferase